MLKRFRTCVDENKSFIFESTASGITDRLRLDHAKQMGYEINLVFLWLLSHDQAVKRVAQRVKQKGHNIPEEVIIRRYYRGLNNLINIYLPVVDTALVLDNSEPESGVKKVIARKDYNYFEIEDKEIWKKINEDMNVKI